MTLYIYIYTHNFWRNLSRKIMGGHFSKRRRVSSSRPSWSDQNGYPGSPFVQPASYYTPQHHLAPSSSSSYFDYGLRTPQPHMLNRRYSRIADNYYTLDQVSSLFQEISQKKIANEISNFGLIDSISRLLLHWLKLDWSLLISLLA